MDSHGKLHTFIGIRNFHSRNILNFFGFEPWIIFRLFLNIEGVSMPETQRIIQICTTVSLHDKASQKWSRITKFCIDSEKVNLQAVLQRKYTKISSFDYALALHYS